MKEAEIAMVTVSYPVSLGRLNRGGSFSLPGLGLLLCSITRLHHEQPLLWGKFHHAYATRSTDLLAP